MPSRSTTGRCLGEIKRHDRDVLALDVLPDVGLGPVRQREDADRLARRDARVVDVPHFRPLVLRVPDMLALRKEKMRSLARDFSSSRRAPPKAASKPYLSSAWRSATVFMMWVCVFEPCTNGLMPSRTPSWLMWTEQVEAELARHLVAKRDHLAELPGRVDMEERERRLGRIERLHGQMHEHGRILAHRIEHHRLGEGRRHLAENVDRLGFEPIEMGKFCQHFSSKRESDARLARGLARPDIRIAGILAESRLVSRRTLPKCRRMSTGTFAGCSVSGISFR